MKFFYDLNCPGENIAIITENDQRISYGELIALCEDFSERIESGKKNLIFILCSNTYEALCGYLACLRSDNVALLLNAKIDNQLLRSLVDKYKPDYFWSQAPMSGQYIFSIGNYSLYKNEKNNRITKIHSQLGLLLSTSGSTGSPKLVRLSKRNLQANVDSICEYLKISEFDRPVTVLPMYYTYGLSILNTHLNKGATILMTDASIMQSEFWDFAKTNKVTSLSGVPYSYQMYKRLNIFKMNLPSLQVMTQAGGKLSPKLSREFADQCSKSSIKFFIMYGQTEATSRMSYLPCEHAMEKSDSIGLPIPGGTFHLIDEEGCQILTPGVAGELVYQGENVMMGYAENEEDLSLGYELDKKLFTGDLAKFDEEGYYYIIGRKKRFIKLFGNRVGLDEVEMLLKSKGYDCACTGVDDKLKIYTTSQEKVQIKSLLSQLLNIHITAFEVIYVKEFAKNEAGKVLYSKLGEVN